MTNDSREDVDVLVVGAGFAGLTAARVLSRAGLDVRLLEARDRPGGRVYTIQRDGFHLEMGAAFIGPGQEPLKALATELGVSWTRRPSGGRDLFYTVETRGGDPAEITDAPGYDVASALEVLSTLDAMAQDVPAERPWDAPDAIELDRWTLGSWMDAHVSPDAREPASILCEAYMGDRYQISLLHALFYSKANGGFAALLGLDRTPHDDQVFREGGGTIAARLADSLGDAIRFSEPVVAITQHADHVVVESARSTTTARHVILAMPPGVAARIRFDPELPAPRRELSMRYQTQSEMKFQIAYERPFWRDAGLSGSITGDGGFLTLDSSVDGGPAVLAGFYGFGAGRAASDDTMEARREATTRRLARFFGDAALAPIAYEDEAWQEQPWSLGCVHFAPPGMWTSCGPALRERFGRIVWAGAETATEMTGQMDGAVRSGLRAADEVMAAAAAA